MDELSERRWQTKHDPTAHKPIDALRAMIRDIEGGDFNPDHIIIVYSEKKDEDRSRTGYYQAGNVGGYYGALGMLTRAAQIMGGDT